MCLSGRENIYGQIYTWFKSIKTVKIYLYDCGDLGCTNSEENTGKTSQDKFMLDKQFQLKNMKKILKKINCEEKFTPKPLRKRIPVKYFLHGKRKWICKIKS